MKNNQKVFYLSPETALDHEVLETKQQIEPQFTLGQVLERVPEAEAPFLAFPTKEKALVATKVEPMVEHDNFSPRPELQPELTRLAQLIANVTEAYTVGIFIADPEARTLHAQGVQTLSRDFVYEGQIGYGCGLVGWTAENAVRISVCPFENDSTTLLYYSKNQDLKSFIAVPILDQDNSLLGVISCDSKKSYAFAKVTEKILLDCAAQAATLINLTRRTAAVVPPIDNSDGSKFSELLENFRSIEDERTLLARVAELPKEFVSRDALVVMTIADGRRSSGIYSSSTNQSTMDHRLLDIVCRHNKVICGERSVHARPTDDIKQRSFLSIPFHVLNREAGSLNLLSKPFGSFNANEIAALEKIAKVIGQSLERLRLKDRFASTAESSSLLSWKQFSAYANTKLAEANGKRGRLSVLRFSFENLMELEELAGIEVAHDIVARVQRLIEQVARPPAVSCSLYGFQMLTLAEASEADVIVMRLRRLIDRLQATDFVKDPAMLGVKLGQLINKGLSTATVNYPKDGATILDLASKGRGMLGVSLAKQTIEEVANAGNW